MTGFHGYIMQDLKGDLILSDIQIKREWPTPVNFIEMLSCL